MALELLAILELVLTLLLEAQHQGIAHGQHDHREWQRGYDAGGLQGGQSAGDQQNGGHQPLTQPPDGAVQHGGILIPDGEQGRNDQGARVAGGDEVGADEQSQHPLGDPAEGLPVQQLHRLVERQGDILIDRGHHAATAEQLQIHGSTAEHGEPEHAEQGGHQQDTEHELADGTPLGDTGDEHADKGRPRNPPAPVEGGPARLPGRGAVGLGIGPEAQLDDVLQVVTYVLHIGVEDVGGRPQHQEEAQHEHAQPDIELGEDLHPASDAGDRRQGGDQADAADEPELVRLRYFHAEHLVEAGIHLGDPQAKGGRHPEHGTKYRQHVGGVTPEAVDAIAEQRIEHGADGQRQLAPVAEEGERQADDHVDGPRVQAPVEEGETHGDLGRLRGHPFGDEGVALQVVHGLGDAPEHQPYSHAGAEQHGKPGEVAEFRYLVVVTQPDAAEAAEHQIDGEEQEQGDHQDVVPLEPGDDLVLRPHEPGGGGFGDEHPEQQEQGDDGERRHGHGRVEAFEQPFVCSHLASLVVVEKVFTHVITGAADGAVDQLAGRLRSVVHQADGGLTVHRVALAEEDGHGHAQVGDAAGDPEPVEVVGAADELQLGQPGIEAGQVEVHGALVREEVHQHIGIAQFVYQLL